MDYIFLLISYLVGSIPFGLLLTKLSGGGDIRKVGSGNIGATNVYRSGQKFVAFLTLLMDGLKLYLSILIIKKIFHPEINIIYASGISCILGHLFPVWLKFRGGKGVATTLGFIFFINPYLGGVFCITWLLIFKISKISSISSILSSLISLIIILFAYNDNIIKITFIIIFILMLIKHYSNLIRIIKGQEHQIK